MTLSPHFFTNSFNSWSAYGSYYIKVHLRDTFEKTGNGGTKDASFDLSIVVFHCTVVYASLLLEGNGIVMERCNPPI